MMRHSPDEIRALLAQLDTHTAEELESDSLDFKECRDEVKLRELARRQAVCLANASGGTVVFGVRERVRGRAKAVIGIDFAPDLLALQGHLYDAIDPKLAIEFEWLFDGPYRLLLMHVHAPMPPYTTTAGEGWMRIGRECKPLTGSLRHRLEERAGRSDPTPRIMDIARPFDAISPTALEILRREMRAAGAPTDLIDYPDRDLCARLGITREGRLTFGGLLVAGREEVIAEHAPAHEWKYCRMRDDTDYETPPVGGREAILVALDKLMLLVGQNNPVTVVQRGLFHPEFPRYPVIALREALLNAFCHRDYTMPGMVFIRHYRDRFEISSPGGFVGDVSPSNILHHPPVTRNRYLVETILLATRLVNRSNLGVSRMYRALLEEGKEPPRFSEIGQTVQVAFLGHALNQEFRALLSLLTFQQGATLDVDDLLLLHFFRRRREARWEELREAYPYSDDRLKDKLARLEHELLMIDHIRGRNAVYRLSERAAVLLTPGTTQKLARRLDREAVKLQMLAALKERPLSNRDLRAQTNLNRNQITDLLQELEAEGRIRLEGRGAGAQWRRVDVGRGIES